MVLDLSVGLPILAWLADHSILSLLSLLVFGVVQFDEVNTVSQKMIMPGVVDNFFKSGPLIALCKSRFTRKWVGPQIQENYLYKALKGGAYSKGAQFDVTKHQTKSGLLFIPKYYQVNVTEYLEDIEVEKAGPMAMFSTVKTDLAEAALTMSAILEIAAFRHGQNLAGDDRSKELNGMEEAFTNGTDTTFSGATFPSYGGQTRVDVSPALNSPTGLIPANVAGAITYRVLQHSFLSATIGSERPTYGLTTNRAMGFIAENFQPQQVVDTVAPEIGWPGLKFLPGATIVMSQYCPGADGVNDPQIGNYNAANETFWWLNFGPQGEDAYIRLYIAQSPKFAFGFTGFKGARDDNQVSGQVLFAGNFTFRANRLMRGLFGISK